MLLTIAFGMLMKTHVMPPRHLHAATTTTPVSRQHLDYLCLRTGADLGKGLLDLEASLLPHLHDLEALKVVESSPLLESRALLGPCALVELLLNLVLLPLLRDVADTAGAGKLGDDNGREGEFRKRNFLAGDGGLLGGTIDEDLYLCEPLHNSNRIARNPYTLVVDDLDNSG
jgi:hypothetical protein